MKRPHTTKSHCIACDGTIKKLTTKTAIAVAHSEPTCELFRKSIAGVSVKKTEDIQLHIAGGHVARGKRGDCDCGAKITIATTAGIEACIGHNRRPCKAIKKLVKILCTK